MWHGELHRAVAKKLLAEPEVRPALEVWRVLTVVGGEPGVPGVGEGPPVLTTEAGQGLRPSLPQH